MFRRRVRRPITLTILHRMLAAEDAANRSDKGLTEDGSHGGEAGADDAEAGLYERKHGGVGFEP